MGQLLFVGKVKSHNVYSTKYCHYGTITATPACFCDLKVGKVPAIRDEFWTKFSFYASRLVMVERLQVLLKVRNHG